MKKNLLLIAVLTACGLTAAASEATFAVTADKVQTVQAGKMEITFDGPIQTVDGQAVMAFGEKCYKFPAKGLLGKQGTIVLEFALAPEMKKSAHPARTLAVLRLNGREEIGLYYFFGNPKLQYRFANQKQNFYGGSGKLTPGKIYRAVLTWDGEKVRCYLDGKLLQEKEQPFPVDESKINDFNIGPFRDSYYVIKPWYNDTLLRSVQLYNRALTAAEISAVPAAAK